MKTFLLILGAMLLLTSSVVYIYNLIKKNPQANKTSKRIESIVIRRHRNILASCLCAPSMTILALITLNVADTTYKELAIVGNSLTVYSLVLLGLTVITEIVLSIIQMKLEIEEKKEAEPEINTKHIRADLTAPMIQWTGQNLREVVSFTGKSPKFDEYFKSWDEFEQYVHAHNDIFKLFCEDGSHYEVPVGAWIVKTPDGYNVPSVARFVHAKQEQPVLPGIEEPGIPGKDFIPVEWVDACEMYGKWKIVKQE